MRITGHPMNYTYILCVVLFSCGMVSVEKGAYLIGCSVCFTYLLQSHHNEHDGVSNHQPYYCLLNRLFRRSSKKTWKLRVTGLFRGIHQWPVNSPHKGPVTQKMFPFDAIIMVCFTYCLHYTYNAHIHVMWYGLRETKKLPFLLEPKAAVSFRLSATCMSSQ